MKGIKYIVELEAGCWLASASGDPLERTTRVEYAERFTVACAAEKRLAEAREYRPFLNAKIIQE